MMPPEIFEWRHIADIILVALIVYLFLLVFRGTIAMQALRGLIPVGLVVIVAYFFYLETLSWIIERLAPVILVGIIVLFQPEIRRGLARMGERSFGSFIALEGERVIEEVARAAVECSRNRHGLLIAFERDTGLESFIETGVLLNAEVTEEVLLTIFFPKTALHDGGVIIRGNTVVAAGCTLPFAHDENLKVKYGMRHRAALGLSKETDAVVVVVSEEKGDISIATGGQLVRGIDDKMLREMLTLYLGGGKPGGRG
ncbi:MAG: diadenylate cyclase CdaA [Candidatus Hydrogenedentota bacterium]